MCADPGVCACKLSALAWMYLGVCLYIEETCDTYKYTSFRVRPAGKSLGGWGRRETQALSLLSPSARYPIPRQAVPR